MFSKEMLFPSAILSEFSAPSALNSFTWMGHWVYQPPHPRKRMNRGGGREFAEDREEKKTKFY
jgi:hypothetical protein